MSRTPTMTAQDIKPCASCGQHPLTAHGLRQITFHVVTVQRAVVNQRKAHAHLGLAMQFSPSGGLEGAGLAAVLGDPHIIDLPAELTRTLHVCETCAASKSLWVLAHETPERAFDWSEGSDEVQG